jgi:hypothetical protein
MTHVTALRLVEPSAIPVARARTPQRPRVETLSPIRWSAVVTNLRAAGMTQKAIARRCGMEPQTVSRLENEAAFDPRFTQALALLDLHVTPCPEKHRMEELRA